MNVSQFSQAEDSEVNPLSPDLHREHELNQAILDTTTSLVIVLDPQGGIVRFNRACEKLSGYSFEEVRGHKVWDLLLDPAEVGIVRKQFETLKAHKFPNQLENYWITRDGGRRLIAWNNTALVDPEEQVEYIIGTGADITARRRMENALRESEERYSSLFNNSHAAMLLIDPPTGEIVDANPAAVEFYGYTLEELQALHITDINRLAPVQVFEEMKAAEQSQRKSFNFQHRLASGEIRDVEVFSGPIRVQGRNLLYSIIHDISERKAAERARERSLESLNNLVDSSSRLLAEKTIDNLLQITARAAIKLTDAAFALVLYRTPGEPTQLHAIAQRTGQAHSPSDSVLSLEQGLELDEYMGSAVLLHMLTPDLERLPGLADQAPAIHSLLGARLTTPNGQCAGRVFVTGKCTRRTDPPQSQLHAVEFSAEDEALLMQLASLASLSSYQIESRQEAEKSASEMSAILNGMLDAVAMYDADGNVVRLNPAAINIYGYNPNASKFFDAVPYANLRHLDRSPVQINDLPSWQALHSESTFETPFIFIDARGQERYIQATGTPLIMDDERLGAVVVWHDVTQLHQTEEALKMYARRLEQSNRDLQDFAFISSHDLQEPLRKIQVFGEQLQARYKDQLDETGQDYLNRMQKSAAHMHDLIHDLLIYSQISNRAQPFSKVSLRLAVEAALESLGQQQPVDQGRVEIGDLPAMKGDRTQLTYLFKHLLSNAFKFQSPERPLIISIQAERLPINELLASEHIQIRVTDNGIGFEQHLAQRVFQPFQQLHNRNRYSGTGMGLAICRKIVERHGGTIIAESKPKEGTTFIITLPLE